VIEGEVDVSDARHGDARLGAHSRLDLSSERAPQKTQIRRTDEGQLLALLGPRHLWQERELGVLKIEASTSVTQVLVDGEGPYTLPLSSYAASGKHSVSLQNAAGEAQLVEVDVVAGKVSNVGLPQATDNAAPAVRTGSSSPAALLKQAREALKRGEPQAALNTYRQRPGSNGTVRRSES
jgi:hypothetical protein